MVKAEGCKSEEMEEGSCPEITRMTSVKML
jgi:hypothetical protein